jgi:hypothetical protein
MRQSGFRVWKVLAGLAAAGLCAGCKYLPDTGAVRQEGPPETFFGTEKAHLPPGTYAKFQVSPDRGYNGTIAQLGSSIDPRTPEAAGKLGNSRLVDVTGRPAPPAPELGVSGKDVALEVGNPQGPADMGWRARLGYDVRTRNVNGPQSAESQRGYIPGP